MQHTCPVCEYVLEKLDKDPQVGIETTILGVNLCPELKKQRLMIDWALKIVLPLSEKDSIQRMKARDLVKDFLRLEIYERLLNKKE